MNHTLKKLTRSAALALATVGLSATFAGAQTVQGVTPKFPAAPITLRVDEFTPVRAGGAQIELPWCIAKVVAIMPGSSLWGTVPPALRYPFASLGTYDR